MDIQSILNGKPNAALSQKEIEFLVENNYQVTKDSPIRIKKDLHAISKLDTTLLDVTDATIQEAIRKTKDYKSLLAFYVKLLDDDPSNAHELYELQDSYMIVETITNLFNYLSNGHTYLQLAEQGSLGDIFRRAMLHIESAYMVTSPKNRQKIIENCELMKIPVEIFDSNIFNVVSDIKENPCYLCARMRRGCLYEYAKSKGCNKIALGHHFDDIVETLLMSILYGSQIQGMLPKLMSTNHPGMELIRPLSFVKEKDIINWANSNELEFLRCACRFTEGLDLNKENSKRQEIKKLIKDLKKVYPNIDMNIYRSMYNVNLDTLIGYKQDGIRHSYLDDYKEKLGKK